jgi:hypothetical protein
MLDNDYDYDNDNDNEPPRDFCTAPLVLCYANVVPLTVPLVFNACAREWQLWLAAEYREAGGTGSPVRIAPQAYAKEPACAQSALTEQEVQVSRGC